MIQTETRTIDGVSFEISQLGFTSQRKIFVKLAKTLGPGMAKMLAAVPSLDAMRGANFDAYGASDALSELLVHLDDTTLEYFFEEFGKNSRYLDTSKDAKPVMHSAIRETIFRGRLLLAFKWLAASIEVNYADFFSALRGGTDDDLPAPEA